MKVVIAGSRSIHSFRVVADAIRGSGFQIDEIVSGGAKGVDTWAEHYARTRNIDLVVFHANWNKYGKSAGVIRSKKMLDYADALIAIWDGESKGTQHTINLARDKGLTIYLVIVDTVSLNVKGTSQVMPRKIGAR